MHSRYIYLRANIKLATGLGTPTVNMKVCENNLKFNCCKWVNDSTKLSLDLGVEHFSSAQELRVIQGYYLSGLLWSSVGTISFIVSLLLNVM